MSRKTKIFYLITKGNWGGAQRYVYELATVLPRTDFDVTVILGEGEILEKKLKNFDLRVIKLASLKRDINVWQDLLTGWQILLLFMRERPDIIHLNSSKIGGIGALAGRLAGIKKIIFTGHGWAFNEERVGISKKLITLSHWLTIKFCHQVISVSETTRQQILKLPFIKARKIIVIHNGLPTIKFFEKSLSRREILPNHNNPSHQLSRAGKFWIGTISELHKNKGLDYLIEAFTATVRVMLGDTLGWSLNLIIIGEGEERKNLQKLIDDKKMSDRIFLVGQIPDARSYLKAFDIFTLTSRTEAFPYAILEAGAAGLPIIASEVGGIPEVITGPELGILVPPGNVEEIKRSLLFLIRKPKYRILAGTNLRRRVLSTFSIKKMIEKTVELYH